MSADSEQKVIQDRLPRKKQPQSYGKRIVKRNKLNNNPEHDRVTLTDDDLAETTLGFMGK